MSTAILMGDAPVLIENPPASQRIQTNFAALNVHATKAEACLARNQLAAAAVHASVAAQLAIQNHAGVFWSPRLEKILNTVGRRMADGAPVFQRKPKIEKVVHVATHLAAVGGHTKMICQWVKADASREHSLILTQHAGEIPAFVRQTFGERIQQLNHTPGGLLDWAKKLRRLSRNHDAVVLHVHGDDVIPSIAFAETEKYPPVMLLNHADHLFWLGSSVVHLDINLRDAAQEISINRRGIATERNILMPTLVEPISRTRTREEAKAEIGIDPAETLIVSAARSVKYRTVNGMTFAGMHSPVLARHPNARLLVVGGGAQRDDWKRANEECGGRIVSLAEQKNPKVYFEAADIYVDSYPFVSSTSMMEAACYGLPLLTLFTGAPETRIFGINHVALVGTCLQATTLEEYRLLFDRLIGDTVWRDAQGDAAGKAVRNEHQLPGWSRWLEAVYAKALDLPPLNSAEMLTRSEPPSLGEPDTLIEDLFGGDYPAELTLKSYLGVLPPRQRIAYWSMLKQDEALNLPKDYSCLLPEWAKRYVKDGLLAKRA